MADSNSITIEGVEYSIDDFELGDLEWLEEHIGKPLTDLRNLNSVKASVAMVYLIRRRGDPAFTLDDARKLKMTALFGAEDDAPEQPENPKEQAVKRPPKKAARS